MEKTTQLIVSVERGERYVGNWNRYLAVLAWLTKQNDHHTRDWKRIPRAHKALQQAWERRMRYEGYI